MNPSNCLTLFASPQLQPTRNPHQTLSLPLPLLHLRARPRRKITGKERDSETGLYYYGARYLDAKISRWLSGDPAVAEYIPSAPVNDEARKRNGNLPGMGGVFNYVNLHVYHYAGNNPVRYVDPNGEIFWIPIFIAGAVIISVLFQSDRLPPPPELNISRTMRKLIDTNYGTPSNNVPTLKNANSPNRETRERIKIGNNVFKAVGASFPAGELNPEHYDDGRTGGRKTAMDALGLIGDIAGRIRNRDGYFAGDIILEVYKTDGKATDWIIKEACTLADGSHVYREYREDEAFNYILENKYYLNEAGLLEDINKALGL